MLIAAAVDAQSRRSWPDMMKWLRTATTCGTAVVEAVAWFMLYGVYGGDSDYAGAAPLDKVVAADCAARGCTTLLRANGGGAPPAARCELFISTVSACRNAVAHDYAEPDTDAWSAVINALRAVVTACEKSSEAAQAAAAVHALSGLNEVATTNADYTQAARHLRRLLAVAERAGPFSDAFMSDLVATSRMNLAVLEAQTPEELQLARQQQHEHLASSNSFEMADIPSEEPLLGVERPACSACGAQPLTLKLCGGTCGGAVRYCDAACHAAHIRQHMRESGCKKRK